MESVDQHSKKAHFSILQDCIMNPFSFDQKLGLHHVILCNKELLLQRNAVVLLSPKFGTYTEYRLFEDFEQQNLHRWLKYIHFGILFLEIVSGVRSFQLLHHRADIFCIMVCGTPSNRNIA